MSDNKELPRELRFRLVGTPTPNKFYYLFFGSGLMIRSYYKGGEWKIPKTLLKELFMVMSEEEAMNVDVSNCQIFELVVVELVKKNP